MSVVEAPKFASLEEFQAAVVDGSHKASAAQVCDTESQAWDKYKASALTTRDQFVTLFKEEKYKEIGRIFLSGFFPFDAIADVLTTLKRIDGDRMSLHVTTMHPCSIAVLNAAKCGNAELFKKSWISLEAASAPGALMEHLQAQTVAKAITLFEKNLSDEQDQRPEPTPEMRLIVLTLFAVVTRSYLDGFRCNRSAFGRIVRRSTPLHLVRKVCRPTFAPFYREILRQVRLSDFPNSPLIVLAVKNGSSSAAAFLCRDDDDVMFAMLEALTQLGSDCIRYDLAYAIMRKARCKFTVKTFNKRHFHERNRPKDCSDVAWKHYLRMNQKPVVELFRRIKHEKTK